MKHLVDHLVLMDVCWLPHLQVCVVYVASNHKKKKKKKIRIWNTIWLDLAVIRTISVSFAPEHNHETKVHFESALNKDILLHLLGFSFDGGATKSIFHEKLFDITHTHTAHAGDAMKRFRFEFD